MKFIVGLSDAFDVLKISHTETSKVISWMIVLGRNYVARTILLIFYPIRLYPDLATFQLQTLGT